VTGPDRELEALLRQALADEAGRVEPAADGLRRIRDRTAAGRWRARWSRWSRWSTPALALAGAAAVIAAVAVLPQLLPDDGPTVPAASATSVPPVTSPPASPAPTSPAPTSPAPTSPAPTRPSASPAPTGPPGSPTAASPAPTSPAPTGSGPVRVADMPTVWPYATRQAGAARADADVRDGRYPNLRDPARTAVDFVASYLGRDGLTAARLEAYPPGLRMLVSRDGRPLSTVFLVRVRTGDDAPYVVVGASRAGLGEPDTLTLAPPPAVDAGGLAVRGTVRRPAGAADPQLVVQVRPPGSTAVLARAELTVPLDGRAVAGWSAALIPSAPAPSGVVAAWTVDAGGQPVEFVAAATAPS
jgi:hypothetical protein